jgi:hypothetical protein
MLILANAWGWIVANPLKAALYLFAFLGVVFVISWFACGRGKASVSQEEINRINTANDRERKKEIESVILKNAETVTTVNEQTTIANANVVERNRLLDEKIAEVDKNIVEAKQQGRDVTQEELQCLLVPADCR